MNECRGDVLKQDVAKMKCSGSVNRVGVRVGGIKQSRWMARGAGEMGRDRLEREELK